MTPMNSLCDVPSFYKHLMQQRICLTLILYFLLTNNQLRYSVCERERAMKGRSSHANVEIFIQIICKSN